MSSVTHPHTPARLRARPSRLSTLIATALVICATIAGGLLLSTGDSHSNSSSSAESTNQTDGPNEAARGQAAASAAGAPQPTQTGGPNETARGQATAAASRP